MIHKTDQGFMQLAVDACLEGVKKGQSPFGACIVQGGQVVACTHNHVWLDIDATAHAEVCCIRQACRQVGSVHLTGAVIYSTTEPCPMCFTAIHWARIERIVFGASVEDARSFGFNELQISNATMKDVSGSTIDIAGGVMRDEALAAYQTWREQSGKAY